MIEYCFTYNLHYLAVRGGIFSDKSLMTYKSLLSLNGFENIKQNFTTSVPKTRSYVRFCKLYHIRIAKAVRHLSPRVQIGQELLLHCRHFLRYQLWFQSVARGAASLPRRAYEYRLHTRKVI